MNTRQETKLKMLLALRNFLRANPDVLAMLPNSEEFLTILDAAIVQILADNEQQQYGINNASGNKKKARETLVNTIADGSRKIQAYAMYVKNSDLLNSTKSLESDLRISSDIEVLNIGKGLYAKINENIAQLADYGLTAATQTAFSGNLQDFEAAIPGVRQSKVDLQAITADLILNFGIADEAVANIDALVGIVRLSQPAFYANYKAIRKVVPAGGSTLQVNGVVTDAETGEPVVNATLSFLLSGETEPAVVKLSAAKGGFMIKSLAEGVYAVTISKLGYQTQTVSITVTADALCTLNVKLVKS